MVVEGSSGCLGSLVVSTLERLEGHESTEDVVVAAGPSDRWTRRTDRTTIGPAIGQAHRDLLDVPDSGWFGGVGALVGRVAVDRAAVPRALHVAYALPDRRQAWRSAGPVVRLAVVDSLLAGGVARVDGRLVSEAPAVGRRLAWFPRPVGPAHAIAVPGHEAFALPEVATVRTWLAVGSLHAEFVQALGGVTTDGRIAGLLRARAGRDVRAPSTDVRWAVVAEVRDGDHGVVRAWANGRDPRVAAAGLLAVAATHAAGGASTSTSAPGVAPAPASVLDLAPAIVTLDRLSDLGVLRWSVARPVPSDR